MVWNVHQHFRREIGFNGRCHVGKFQRKWTSVESRSLEEERWNDVLFTSLRNLRMQSFYFEQFTQRINSVSTVQLRVGVKILAQLILGQTHVIMNTSVAKASDQLFQKLEPQEGDSLVQTHKEEAGIRLRIYLQRFEELAGEVSLQDSL